jgi:hypothetical protein
MSVEVEVTVCSVSAVDTGEAFHVITAYCITVYLAW